MLFQRIDEQKKLYVLDLGGASAESVDFFSQFRCKLYFQDFVTEPAIPISDTELSDEQLTAAYRDLFSFHDSLPENCTFDLCLFWDFFSLLDSRAMQAFGKALNPYIAEHTLAHGFGVLNTKTAVEVMNYRIESADSLLSVPINTSNKTVYPHPQRDFESQLPGFSVTRGTLLQKGKLELLLESKN